MTYLSKTNFVQILKACGHPHTIFMSITTDIPNEPKVEQSHRLSIFKET